MLHLYTTTYHADYIRSEVQRNVCLQLSAKSQNIHTKHMKKMFYLIHWFPDNLSTVGKDCQKDCHLD